MATRRMSIGSAGEAIAARFLEQRGAVVGDRNVRVGRDEIDLVVQIDGEAVAVEVKAGLGSEARPWESFDEAKESRVRRAAAALSIHRVDLITVEFATGGVVVRWSPGVG